MVFAEILTPTLDYCPSKNSSKYMTMTSRLFLTMYNKLRTWNWGEAQTSGYRSP